VLSKSHRPINPFYHIGGAFNEYKAAESASGFMYGTPTDQTTYGVLPTTEVRDKTNILDHTSGISQLNAIGRHHPHGDQVYSRTYGGAANFLYCDSHVETMTAVDSAAKRQWGTHYYAISGANEVTNMSKVTSGG
jgi:prepilin-type processing-associated H-X9-DG protein